MSDTPAKPSSRLQDAAKKLPAFRKAAIEVMILALAVIFLVAIAGQFFPKGIIIQRIAVPESLAKRGYTPEVNASQILDQILHIESEASTLKKSETLRACLLDVAVKSDTLFQEYNRVAIKTDALPQDQGK